MSDLERYKQTIKAIGNAIERHPNDFKAYEDYFSMAMAIGNGGDIQSGLAHTYKIRRIADEAKRSTDNLLIKEKYYDLQKKTFLYAAQNNRFEDYLFYIEWDRPANKRFYHQRMSYLRQIVQAYQEVLDGKLDLLTISLIKRAGKSQTGINFVNYLSGKRPDRSTLMEGTGDALVKSFYDGCLEILQSPEYLHYDVFPSVRIVQTNADIKTVNLEKKSRFPTIMCRSIDASQVGLSEATNVLYLDDLVEGREEALDRNRINKKWEVLSGDVLGRRIEGTPIIACGTRYSLYDPIGRLIDLAPTMNWRHKTIELPALDPATDESNYECTIDGNKIFTTGYLRHERDMLSAEQWESEFQQTPFEAKGLTFPEANLNRYINLPTDRDADAIIAVTDTAEGGGDSVCMLIAYIYGIDVFIEDVVFDNSSPEHTKPQCASKLIKHNVGTAVFESNNAGKYFARDVGELVEKAKKRISIRVKRTISNKQTRIEMASDNIIKHFYFKDKSLYKPTDQYGMYMKELTTYTRSGKVKHDDAPDGTALLENEIRNLNAGKVEVIKRPC